MNLCISHHIFLNDSQIDDLLRRKTIEVLGHSVPVWRSRNSTSEPAEEIFCNYILHNSEDLPQHINIHKFGYEINIPQTDPTKNKKLTDTDWLFMTDSEINSWYYDNSQIDVNCLRKMPEAGGFLRFIEKQKYKKGKLELNVLNWVEISRLEYLTNSL